MCADSSYCLQYSYNVFHHLFQFKAMLWSSIYLKLELHVVHKTSRNHLKDVTVYAYRLSLEMHNNVKYM